jgi:hypothetical protein
VWDKASRAGPASISGTADTYKKHPQVTKPPPRIMGVVIWCRELRLCSEIDCSTTTFYLRVDQRPGLVLLAAALFNCFDPLPDLFRTADRTPPSPTGDGGRQPGTIWPPAPIAVIRHTAGIDV